MINQTAARLWPAGVDPVGRRLHVAALDNRPQGMLPAPGLQSSDFTVVGVMADTRNDGLTSPPLPQVFLPYTVVATTGRTLVVRAHGDPMLLLNAVREQVGQIEGSPVNRPITMEEIVGQEVKQPRFNMALFTFFGGLGLALAAIGIFGVLSYSVARRTHEIGVRMALGADRSHVLGLMMAMGGKLVLTGLGVGLAGSLLLGRYLQSEVFSVPVTDPVTILRVR